MSDDECDYRFGPRPRPPEAGQTQPQSSPHALPSWPAASSDGTPPPDADADVLAWLGPRMPRALLP
eukprot:6229103-Pyramimonas_sp.AAC.1